MIYNSVYDVQKLKCCEGEKVHLRAIIALPEIAEIIQKNKLAKEYLSNANRYRDEAKKIEEMKR